MKKLLTLASLLLAVAAHAQTTQYTKIETTHFKGDKPSSKLTKFEGGTIDFDPKRISIDKEAPKPLYYDVVSTGKPELEDEGYYSVEYVCVTTTSRGQLKALRLVAIYSPKHRLSDLIVKNGKSNVDYCVGDLK